MFISKNIKYLRDKEWLSQSNFAELFKLNRGNIASYEAGSEPALSIIISIANYFNISIDDLITSDLSNCTTINNKKEEYPKTENTRDVSLALTTPTTEQKKCSYCTEKGMLIDSLRETLEAQKNDLKSKDMAINAYQEALSQVKFRLEEHGLSAPKGKIS